MLDQVPTLAAHQTLGMLADDSYRTVTRGYATPCD